MTPFAPITPAEIELTPLVAERLSRYANYYWTIRGISAPLQDFSRVSRAKLYRLLNGNCRGDQKPRYRAVWTPELVAEFINHLVRYEFRQYSPQVVYKA